MHAPFLLLAAAFALGLADAEVKSPKEALRPLNDLVGSWKATGTPEGTREQKQRGFWTETVAWGWQFKGKDAWMVVAFDKGKYFTQGDLRYHPDRDRYRLALQTPARETLTFEGPLKDGRLTLDRVDDKTRETQRLTISLLHANRYLYRYEVRPPDRQVFKRVYEVGCTKEGVPFAAGDGKPECVVSGGLGTLRVEHKGRSYYVCCSGCRDAFKDDPETYVREFEAKKQGK